MNLKPNSILFSPKRAFPKWLWDACLLALLIPVYLGHFPPETVNALRPLILATSLCAYGILALKIYVWDNHTLRELLGISLILLLVGLGTVYSGNRCFLSCFLLVFSAKDQDYDKLCRFFFWFFSATLLLNLLLVGAGVLEDTLSTRWEAINFGATRHSYGFGHPNTFGFWTLLLIFSGLLYIPRKGHRALSCLISVLLAFCVFRVTDSKAALLSSLAAIVLCLIAFRVGPWLSSKKWSVPLCLGLYLLGIAAFLSPTLLYQEDNGFFSTCLLLGGFPQLWPEAVRRAGSFPLGPCGQSVCLCPHLHGADPHRAVLRTEPYFPIPRRRGRTVGHCRGCLRRGTLQHHGVWSDEPGPPAHLRSLRPVESRKR